MHAELQAIVAQVEASDPSQRPEAKALSGRVDALGELHSEAERHLVNKTPWHERNILLRATAVELGLSLRDKDLTAVVATARHKRRGQKNGISPGDVFEIPEERWVADQLIAARTMTLVVALQKVGKSAFVSNILGELAKGRGEFLDRFTLHQPSPKLIIVGTDQPLADWREVMVPNGLMLRTELNKYKLSDTVARLFTLEDGVHLDEAGIEKIATECEQTPGAVLVLDAFLSLIGPLGLDADSDAAVEPLQNLLESITPFDITMVVLHHSSKSRAHERASNASAGRGLSRMATHVVNLHWLNPDTKEDERVRLTTQGRSSKSVDCVIEQVERAIFSCHGDSSKLSAEMDLSKVRGKLSERQSNVLSVVEEHWLLTNRAIEPSEVAEQMTEQLEDNARQKALQALDALANKSLVVKITRSDHKRGKVVAFQPIETRRCA